MEAAVEEGENEVPDIEIEGEETPLAAGESDEVVGMSVIREDATLLTVTETGYGRRSPLTDYRIQSRGGKGLTNYRTALYGDVAGVKVVNEDDDVIFISSDGVVIRIPVSEISMFARPAKGVRVMRVAEGERLLTVARSPHDEEEAIRFKPTKTHVNTFQGED